ncbi:uncharacterized protein LOC103974909 isoform X2 [Musa acuminata AAA Group]|uniref:uncharacterized protein LOC103974909 isoform X2 n=1 Tax=Musa acuminata AAA Group TaxID=214697 RepID=UPI0031D8027B
MTSSWNLDRILKLEVRRCVDRGRSLPASYAPLAYEPWTTGTRGCVEDPQYCNYVYIPQLWKIQASLFGHYAFEGPSTSTGIKSGTSNSRDFGCAVAEQHLYGQCCCTRCSKHPLRSDA